MFKDEYAYRAAQKLEREDVPFYALIWAAMRKADTDNTEKLRRAWPEVWSYLSHRYNCRRPPCICEICGAPHDWKAGPPGQANRCTTCGDMAKAISAPPPSDGDAVPKEE